MAKYRRKRELVNVSMGKQERRTNVFADTREALWKRYIRATLATGKSLGVGTK